jgi:hypothetical protein
MHGYLPEGWLPFCPWGQSDEYSWGNRKLALIRARRAEQHKIKDADSSLAAARLWVEENFSEFTRDPEPWYER